MKQMLNAEVNSETFKTVLHKARLLCVMDAMEKGLSPTVHFKMTIDSIDFAAQAIAGAIAILHRDKQEECKKMLLADVEKAVNQYLKVAERCVEVAKKMHGDLEI
jgi:hypothetical protein